MNRKKLIKEIINYSKDELNKEDLIILAMESKKQLRIRLIHINNYLIEQKIFNNKN